MLLGLIFALSTASANLTPVEQVNVGEAYTHRGEPEKALGLLRKALKAKSLSQKNQGRARAALGLAYLQLEKPSKAIPQLEEAVKLQSKKENLTRCAVLRRCALRPQMCRFGIRHSMSLLHR